jgi:hypothetical protein
LPDGPQLERPEPLIWQLVPVVVPQKPFAHVPMPVHATPVPQLAVASHVCTVLPEHWVCPVLHMPAQTPDRHVWFTHAVSFCQTPDGLHVCGCVSEVH